MVDPTYIAYYYSFTSGEIGTARDTALAYTRSIDPDPDDMMQYHVFSIAYDPELTSLLIFQMYGLDDRLYRDQYIAFSFFYRGVRENGDGSERRYEDTGYILCRREDPDGEWTVAQYSETGGDPTALPAEYLPAFGENREVVAGYTQGIDGLKIIARYELSEGNFRHLAYVLDREQLLPAGTALTESELAEFEKLFSIRETEDPWFNYALTSEYADPADVDIYDLMYSGPSEELTQKDRDFAAQAGLTPELLNKYSTDTIDAQLQRLFGITLEESNGVGLDRFVYDPDTDCYYDAHGDSKVSYQSVIGGVWMPNGDVAVYYERQQGIGLNPAQDQMVVVLRPVGDSYRILMNVRAGLGYEVVDRTEPLPEEYTLDDLVTPITRDLEWSTSMIESGVAKFSIPQIYPFSADAVRVQQEIQEDYLRIYHETFTYYTINQNAGMTFRPHYCEISYEACLNGSVLSIVICMDEYTDSQGHRVYNFDLETGALLDTADLLAVLGIDQSDYEELLGGMITKAFTDRFGEAWDPESDLYDQYMEQKTRNDSPENLAAAKLYLDAEGELWAICNIYSMAGSGIINEIFSLSELMQ